MTRSVLTAEFIHETNTFNINKATIDAFRARTLYYGEEAIAARENTNTELAGFLDIARQHRWNLHHVLTADADPSGLVTKETFDTLAGAIVRSSADRKDQLDGILLGLHGAMVTELSPDGEGELLYRIRQVLDRHVPIAITLDPHANVTSAMCDLADIIVSFKTYPHVDLRLTGQHAAQLLHRTMEGEIKPRTLLARPPMLEEANSGRTDTGPMVGWIAEARNHEKHHGGLAVSINGGFGHADVPEVGPTVLVTYDGDETPHRRFAETISRKIWDNRANTINQYLSVDEAMAAAVSHRSDRPLVIADYADNPGGGAYGDGTALLAGMLKAGLTNACLGALVDPELALALRSAPVGSELEISIGGKCDPSIGGGPIATRAKITHTSDGDFVGDGPMLGGLKYSFGPTVVAKVEGVSILIVSNRSQILDVQQFTTFGIDPSRCSVVAVKSMQHFRAAFGPIADRIIICDSGALCTPSVRRLSYSKVRRPIYPLDADTTY